MADDQVLSEDLRELATSLLEVVPLVARAIRAEMRAHRNATLSVPQFRILNFVQLQGKSSLSAVASHMGLSMPSASTMVDALVGRALLSRRADTVDRRKVVIETTKRGQKAWAAAWQATCESMQRRLQSLDPSQRQELSGGLVSLHAVFG